jgi:hypothetical protein
MRISGLMKITGIILFFRQFLSFSRNAIMNEKFWKRLLRETRTGRSGFSKGFS